MYELINTSVPEGLIAGTHGFATVAMTKGMPDAIRMRVESFCAYPHRTSSHDQNYFLLNPVNWFHVALQNGDHVVGRTAPAEFDYTGRTNRISRILHFGGREMPQAGAAFVLETERQKFSEGWTGKPRYLESDKSMVTRLGTSAGSSKTTPEHWISMFGDQGTEYARKLALLLLRNLQGGGKGIYFKASPSKDSDGTRLLGLFSDLIDLLPPTFASQVTFSTFSPCVPNGVVCHLRGIYDADRAFDLVSTLQPWVDCENCCIKHAELLPEEARVRSSIDNGVQHAPEITTPVQGRGRVPDRPSWQSQSAPPGNGKKSKKSCLPCWLLVGALVFVLLIVSVWIVWPLCKQPTKDDALSAQIAKEKQGKQRYLESWRDSKIRELDEVRNRIMRCSDYVEITNSIHILETKRNGLRPELEKGDYLGFNDVLDKVETRFNEVIVELNQKAKACKGKDKEKRKGAERKQSADDDADKAARAEALKKKQRAEEEAKKRQAEQIKPLESLSIDKVFRSNKKWDDDFSNDEKSKLTNDASVVYYYLSGGKCTNSTGRVNKKTTRNPRTRKDQVSYEIKEPDVIDSKWLVVYVPSMKKVFWQWKDIAPVKLFEHDDEACLCDIVFGGKNGGYELCKKKLNEIVYVLSWRSNSGEHSHYYSGDTIGMNRYKQKTHGLEQRIGGVRYEIVTCSNAVKKLEANLVELDCSMKKMMEHLNCFRSLKSKLNNLDKKEEKERDTLKNEMNGEKKNAYNEFSKYFKEKYCKDLTNGSKIVDLDSIKTEDIKKVISNLKEGIGKEINVKKGEINRKKEEMRALAAKLEWRKQVRERIFTINVIGYKDVPEKHRKRKSQGFGTPEVMDSIQNPTGVNGN